MYGTYSPPPPTRVGLPSDHVMFSRARSTGRSITRDAPLPCFVPRSTPIAIPTPPKPVSFLDQQAMLNEYNKQLKQQRSHRRGSNPSDDLCKYAGRHQCDNYCEEYCDLALGSGNSTDEEPDSWLSGAQRTDALPEPYHHSHPVSRSIDFDWTS